MDQFLLSIPAEIIFFPQLLPSYLSFSVQIWKQHLEVEALSEFR